MSTHIANDERPVLIMAGGTGGHIFPGLAAAAELRARGVPVLWLGAEGGLETSLVPQHGIALETLSIGGLRGKGLATMLRTPLRLLRAVRTARAVVRQRAPRAVLSMGGYVAAPGGIAALLAHVPLLVHEQNRVPGLTNRLLARIAQRVLTGFADAFSGMKTAVTAEWVGNPVRAAISALPPPAQRAAARGKALEILVLGGSQGARSLNTLLPEVLHRRSSNLEFRVRHQCGAKNLEQARKAYLDAGVEAEVVPFVDDMAAAYAAADLVVCRAGALTLAELAAAGVASILVPYPHAVDDHQTKNALGMVDAGGGVLVAEGDDFIKRLGATIESLADRTCLVRMGEAARTLARPDAARRIADACLEVAA